jgi:hypothetical protein
MYTVVRSYSGTGAKELFDSLEQNRDEIEGLIRAVKGAMGYTLARPVDGGISVTVCESKAVADETVQIAADWVRANTSTGASAPRVSEGETILHFSRFDNTR